MSRAPVSVPDQTPQVSFAASGTPNDTFPFSFPYWEDEDLVVKTRAAGSDWVLRADYDVVPDSGTESTGYPSGSVVFTAPVVDVEVLIRREKTFERISQFPAGAAIDTFALNRDLNRLLGLQQTLRMLLTGYLKLSDEDVLEGVECLTLPAKSLRIEKMFAFGDTGCIALLPIPESVSVVFHPTTGDYEVAPALPEGIAPWVDTTWTQFPDGDSVWISYSIGSDPAVDGWSAPTRFVGQDYLPNIYSDPTYSGPHEFEFTDGSPVNPIGDDLSGFLSPTSFSAVIDSAGGPTAESIAFVLANGVPTTYLWEWAFGGANITITSPAAASTTFSIGGNTPGEYSGVIQLTVEDGINTLILVAPVQITLEAADPVAPDVLTASTSPADFDVVFNDAAAGVTAFTEATVVGGRPPFEYLWSKVSGDGNLNLNPIDPTTDPRMRFRGTNPDTLNGAVLNATFRLRVRDSAQLDGFTQQQFLVDVPVTMSFASTITPVEPLSVSLSGPASPVNLSAPSDEVGGTIDTLAYTALAINGTAPITYLWEWESGGAGVTIVSPASNSTVLRVGTDSTTYNGVLRCTVTDFEGRVGIVKRTVEIVTGATAAALSVSVEPVSMTNSAVGLYEFDSQTFSVGVVGGTAPFTRVWSIEERLSGPGFLSLALASPQGGSTMRFRGTTTQFNRIGQWRIRCTVTDTANKTAFADATLSMQWLSGNTSPLDDPSGETIVS